MCVGFVIFWGIDRLHSNQTIRMILFGVIITIVSVPLLLFLWKLNTQVLSGRYYKQRQELHTKLQNRYGLQVKVVGWVVGDLYQWLANQPSRDMQGTVYEFFAANDIYTRQRIDLAVRELGIRVIAELPSPFQASGLPPSTLYTYHAPQYFYLTHVSNLPGPSQ